MRAPGSGWPFLDPRLLIILLLAAQYDAIAATITAYASRRTATVAVKVDVGRFLQSAHPGRESMKLSKLYDQACRGCTVINPPHRHWG